MTGTTRTIQQPLNNGSILAAIGMAATVLAAAVAITWGSANLVPTTPAAAAPAPLTAPAVRDLGSRDVVTSPAQGLALDKVRDLGSRDILAAGTGSSPDRLKDDTINGSNQGAPAAHNAGLRAQ